MNAPGPYCFHIQGSLHHNIAPLEPAPNVQPSYAQLYIHDSATANAIRSNHNQHIGIHRDAIINDLQSMLHQCNPYVPLFKQAHEVMQEHPADQRADISLSLCLEPGADARRYNLPTADEVAAVIPGTGEENVRSD